MERGERAVEDAILFEVLGRKALVALGAERKVRIPARASRAQVVDRLSTAEEPYLEFYAACTQAMAYAEAEKLAIIDKAAVTQWQAAAWHLERMYPDRFGQRQRTEVQGQLEVRLSHVSDDELRQEIARLRAALEQG
jgi:hypothetical protein